MRNVVDIGAEAKCALLLDAPDIAAGAVANARVGNRLGEALRDYATVQTLQNEAEQGSAAAIELDRIRVELIAEIRRALSREGARRHMTTEGE